MSSISTRLRKRKNKELNSIYNKKPELVYPRLLPKESTSYYLRVEYFLYYLNNITRELEGVDSSLVKEMSAHYDHILFVDLHTRRARYSNYLEDRLKFKVRFLIVPIHLFFPMTLMNYIHDRERESKQLSASHSNVLVIDTKKRIIEYFEPHGKNMMDAISNIIDVPYSVYAALVKVDSSFTSYEFKNASGCSLGPQALQSSNMGSCLAWSLFYIHFRLLNPELSSEEIMKELNHDLTRDDLDVLIKSYIYTVETYYDLDGSDAVIENVKYIPYSKFDMTKISWRIADLLNQYYYFLNLFDFNKSSMIFNELMTYSSHPSFSFHMMVFHKRIKNLEITL